MQYNSKKISSIQILLRLSNKNDFATNKTVLSFNFCNWKDSPTNYFINTTNREFDEMVLNSNFNYHDNHEFHKLKQKCSNNRNFSIIHTNICSLQANSEKLELFCNNLNHNFDVIALSKTWTSDLFILKHHIYKAINYIMM